MEPLIDYVTGKTLLSISASLTLLALGGYLVIRAAYFFKAMSASPAVTPQINGFGEWRGEMRAIIKSLVVTVQDLERVLNHHLEAITRVELQLREHHEGSSSAVGAVHEIKEKVEEIYRWAKGEKKDR